MSRPRSNDASRLFGLTRVDEWLSILSTCIKERRSAAFTWETLPSRRRNKYLQ